MTADQYVASVIQKHAVNTALASPASNAANQVVPVLKTWAGQSLLGIQFSGSYAKGTAISLGTDVDLFIFPVNRQRPKWGQSRVPQIHVCPQIQGLFRGLGVLMQSETVGRTGVSDPHEKRRNSIQAPRALERVIETKALTQR